MKKLLFSVTLFTAMITATALTQGCITGVLVGVGMAGVAAGAATQPARAMEGYRRYVTQMKKINMKREKAKLKTRPILTYKEWTKGEGKPKAVPCILTAY